LTAVPFRRIGCVWLVALAGCYQPPAPPAPIGESAPPTIPASQLSANEILQKLLATYRGAATYEDQGVVRLEFRQRGQKTADQWPCAVKFARPNKLSLAAFQATVKCDGRELAAHIEDEATGNLDGQVLVRPAPPSLSLTDLASDELLYNLLCGELGRQPIQLELLLESGGLATALAADVACRKLDDARADGRDCFRVAMSTPGGPFVFWVDRADFLLRRIDYPVAALLPALANDPTVSDLGLSAELAGAKIGGPISDEQFALEIPAGAKRMKTFVQPPQPLPSELFGQQPGTFFFTDLSGNKLQSEQLAGKIAVLVWYHGDPACQATLAQVSAARQRLKEEPAVAFLAVATDPTSASNAALVQRLAEWRVDLPIVRDLEAFGDKVFRIKFQPAIVVLSETGRVQLFQVGGSPQLADQIAQIVQQLKTGTDLASEILARHQRERQQYDELVVRGGPEPGQVIALPEAVIRQRSQPKILKLNELWSCRELKSPGNILLAQEPGKPARIFVVEGWRTMTELTHGGQVAGRHPLDLPERAAITFARTTTDKTGKRYFVAAAPLAPQYFLLDESWKLLAAHPAGDRAPLQLLDLAWADVNDGDGVPEVLAGSAGDIGLVAIGLNGDSIWRNRAFPNVVSVAVSQPDDLGNWAAYLTGEQGTVLRVNRFGNEEAPQKVGNWPIHRLIAASFSKARQASLLGLSNDDKGVPLAVGITSELKEAWNYPLPRGVHQRPIEPVASSNLLPGRQGEWWLAGPDGSIHVISEDGELHDWFYYGAVLTGLAAARLDGKPALLVATEDGVAAWGIE
jgi:hypothetical protein